MYFLLYFSSRLRSLDCLQNIQSMRSRGSHGLPGWISMARYQQRRKHTSYSHVLNLSYSHVTSHESSNGVFCKTNVSTNGSTTFAAAWTVSSSTMALSTLDVVSQTGVPSVVCSTTNLGQVWRDTAFADESRFYLPHHDDYIRVWRHCRELMLRACTRHRHAGL